MTLIIIVLILTITIQIHILLKTLWRNKLKDRLLEDQQAITEYERFKMEQEIKELKKQIKNK